MKIGICPHCRKAKPLTRDHVMPAEFGGQNSVSNRRWVCQGCNVLRASCGHCVGAMACVLDLATSTGRDPHRVAIVLRRDRARARRAWRRVIALENRRSTRRGLPAPYAGAGHQGNLKPIARREVVADANQKETTKKARTLSDMASDLDRAQRALVGAAARAAEARASEDSSRNLVNRLQAELDAEIERMRGAAPPGSRWNSKTEIVSREAQ